MESKDNKYTIIKYALNAVFIFFFIFWLSRVDVTKLWHISKGMQTRFVLWFIASYTLSYIMYAIKYQILFQDVKHFKYKDFFFLTCSSSYSNFIAPGSGELLKIYILNQRENIPFGRSAIIILLERIFSLYILLVLVLLIFLFVDALNITKKIAFYSLMLLVGLTVTGVFFIHKKQKIKHLLEKLLRWLPFKTLNQTDISQLSLTEISNSLLKVNIIFYFIVFSILKFVFDGFRLYFILKMLGYELGYFYCLAGNIMINFLIMIPILPGAFGTFEFVSVSILHYGFGVPLEIILLEIFLERIFSTVLLFIYGAVSLNYLALSKDQIKDRLIKEHR